MSTTAIEVKETTNQIAEFKPFAAKLAEYHRRYDNVVYDMEDEDQNKQARSDRLAIGKEIASLDRVHADIKAPLLEKTRVLDGARKELKDDLLGIQQKIKGQIEAHERKKQEHEDALQARVDYFINIIPEGADSAYLRELLATVEGVDVDDTYEHRKADATLAKVDAIKKLTAMIADTEKREAEQAELERLRKEKEERERADREERIRQEAAENARKQAEAAAKREIELAKQKQLEAEQAAERAAQAERERIERQQREAAKKAEAERLADAARKAAAKHQDQIHAEAIQSLIDHQVPEDIATAIVQYIRDGKIAHVVMNY